MATQDQYQWRRDKDGLGVWEHRGKVAVAGYGHSPVDRRWDGVSMDKTLGAYSILACQKAMDDAGVTPDQIDGVICCDSHIAGPSGGSASQWAPRPYFAPPYDSEWGLTLVNAEWLIEQMGLPNVKFAPTNVPTIGEMVGMASQAVGDGLCTTCLVIYPDGQPGRAVSPRRRERRRLRQRRPPVDGALGQSRRERLHQHLPAQPVLPQIRRHTRRSRALRDQPAQERHADAVGLQRHPRGAAADRGRLRDLAVHPESAADLGLRPAGPGVHRLSLHHRRARAGHAATAGLRAEPFAAQLQAAQHAGGPGRNRRVDRPRGPEDVRGRRAWSAGRRHLQPLRRLRHHDPVLPGRRSSGTA